MSIIVGKHKKVLRFKFHKNRIINEEFDFWGVKGCPDFNNFGKASYRPVVPTHIKNLSTLAQLESV